MKLGASTIPYKDEPLAEDLLSRFAEAGVESVELSDFHPGFDFADAGLRALVQRSLDERGLHLNSIHIHLRSREPRCDLATLDAVDLQPTLAMHREAVDMAAALGGCILVTHDIVIPEPGDGEGPQRQAAFLENLGRVADYAAPHGVRLALENTGRGYSRVPDRLVGLIEDLGAANVGVVIDTGHRNLCGEPPAAIRTVGRHLFSLHLHDNHGRQDEHLLPGRGVIAWGDVIQALRDVDYDGVFMYEISRSADVGALKGNMADLLEDGG